MIKTLKNVNEVYLDEFEGKIKLSVKRKDDTVYSLILTDPEGSEGSFVTLDTDAINTIRKGIEIWRKDIGSFADQYIATESREFEFFNDIVLLCTSLAKLPSNYLNLLRFRDAGSLMHNRIIAQLLAKYSDLEVSLSLTPQKNSMQKVHDFNIGSIKCEVKTIQSLGEIERDSQDKKYLTENSFKSLVAAIRDDVQDASKVGNDGMIFISSWSPNINGVLRKIFEDSLVQFPPSPTPGTTTLIISSKSIFDDFYVTFPTSQFLSIIESALMSIRVHGIDRIHLVPLRQGLVYQMMTAANPNSAVGIVFKLPRPIS